jgi:hypothetical protein
METIAILEISISTRLTIGLGIVQFGYTPTDCRSFLAEVSGS